MNMENIGIIIGTICVCGLIFAVIYRNQAKKYRKSHKIQMLQSIEAFIDQVPFGVVVLNPNTQKEYFNHWIRQHFQSIENETQWQTIEAGLSEATLTNFYRLKREFYIQNRPFELYLPLSDQKKLHVQALYLENPIPLYFICLSFEQSVLAHAAAPKQEMTEAQPPQQNIQHLMDNLQDAEKRLQNEQQENSYLRSFYDLILNEIPIPIWLRDQTKAVIFQNQYAQKEKITHRLGNIPAQKEVDNWFVEEKPLEQYHTFLGTAKKQASSENIQQQPLENSSLSGNIVSAIDHTGLAFVVFNENAKLIAYNAQLCKLWHIDPEQLQNLMSFQNFYYVLRESGNFELPDHKDWLWRQTERFKQPFPLTEELLATPHKTIKQFAIRADDSHFIWFFDDISQSTELERSITALNIKQNRILDNLPDSVLLFTDKGDVLFANPALHQMWDASTDLEEMPTITEFITQYETHILQAYDHHQRNITDWRSTFLDKELQEGHIITHDGRAIDFLKLPLASGEKLIIFRDQSEAYRLIQEKEITKEALSSSLKRTYAFIADFSSRLRNPSTNILGIAEILTWQKYGNLNARQQDYLSDLLAASQDLDATLQDIVDVSAINADQMHFDKQKLSLFDVIKDPLMQLKSVFDQHNIDLTLSIPSEAYYIHADLAKMKQVFDGLFRTAIDFSRSPGKMSFETHSFDDYIDLQIFFIIKPNSTLTPILGEEHNLPIEAIGSLQLIYQLIKLHDGDIRFQYQKDQVTIMVKLPIIQ